MRSRGEELEALRARPDLFPSSLRKLRRKGIKQVLRTLLSTRLDSCDWILFASCNCAFTHDGILWG